MLDAEAVGSPTTESASVLEEVKNHLQEMANLLGSTVNELVQDAKPVRAHFEALQGHLPESVEEALIFAAHLEIYRFPILRAQKRLPDRETQAKISQDKERHLADAANLEDQIGLRPDLKKRKPIYSLVAKSWFKN